MRFCEFNYVIKIIIIDISRNCFFLCKNRKSKCDFYAVKSDKIERKINVDVELKNNVGKFFDSRKLI